MIRIFRNKNILIISPEKWEHLFVSKHHYAIELSKLGNTVYFLNPPGKEDKIKPTAFDNLMSVEYSGFIPGLRFLPSFIQKKIIGRKFDYLQKSLKVEFDVIWSFDNSVFYDFSILSNKVLKILHIVDVVQDYQTATAAKTADICLGVIPEIVDKLKSHNPQSFLIGHGVQKFNATHKSTLKLSGEIKVLYMGNLGMPFINWKLIKSIVQSYPRLDFYFIGANMDSKNPYKEKVKELENVKFLPAVPATEILVILQQADILWLCYTEEYNSFHALPHKLMEYFLSGKVILSSYFKQFDHRVDDGLILMSDNEEVYRENFNQVVRNLSFFNSPAKTEARINFGLDNTYENRIHHIENLIIQNINL